MLAQTDKIMEKSGISLYKRNVALANQYLHQWKVYSDSIYNNEHVDRYVVAQNIEKNLIPTITEIAFAIESLCSLWIHILHPFKKIDFLFLDKNKNAIQDLDLQTVTSELIFKKPRACLSDKLESLLLFCNNNYISSIEFTFDKINKIPLLLYPINSNIGDCFFHAKDIYDNLTKIYQLRSKIVHSSPLFDFCEELSSPLDHIIQILNIRYIDSLNTQDFLSRTHESIKSLNLAINCFNVFEDQLKSIYDWFFIPDLRFYDSNSAHYRFISSKITIELNSVDSNTNQKNKNKAILSEISELSSKFDLSLDTPLSKIKIQRKFISNLTLNNTYDLMESTLDATIIHPELFFRGSMNICFKDKLKKIFILFVLDPIEENKLREYKRSLKFKKLHKAPF